MANLHPWMPLYVVDWLEDRELKKLPRVARSFYFDMLCHEWIGGPLPDDMHEVAVILNELPRSLAPHWTSIRHRFVIDSLGRLSHTKLESLRNEALMKSEKAAKSAQERWTRNAIALPTPIVVAMLSESDQSTAQQKELPIGPAQPSSSRPVRAPRGKPECLFASEQREEAVRILSELNAARKRIRPACRGISPTDSTLEHIASRLAEGNTPDDVRHVIAVCEAECRGNPDSFRYFDAVTPFRKTNFARKVGADEALAATQPGKTNGKGHTAPTTDGPAESGNYSSELR